MKNIYNFDYVHHFLCLEENLIVIDSEGKVDKKIISPERNVAFVALLVKS